jgi:hypothetical protein
MDGDAVPVRRNVPYRYLEGCNPIDQIAPASPVTRDGAWSQAHFTCLERQYPLLSLRPDMIMESTQADKHCIGPPSSNPDRRNQEKSSTNPAQPARQ